MCASFIDALKARIDMTIHGGDVAQLHDVLASMSWKTNTAFTSLNRFDFIVSREGENILHLKNPVIAKAFFAIFLDENCICPLVRRGLISNFSKFLKTKPSILDEDNEEEEEKEAVGINCSHYVSGPMLEPLCRKTFEAKLKNGDVLLGVSAMTRKFGFSTENLMSIGFYVHPEQATLLLSMYKDQSIGSLRRHDTLFQQILSSTFRKTFVFQRNTRSNFTLISDELLRNIRKGMSSVWHTGLSMRTVDSHFGSIVSSDASYWSVQCDQEIVTIGYDKVNAFPPIESENLRLAFCSCFFNPLQTRIRNQLISKLPDLLDASMIPHAHTIFDEMALLRDTVRTLPIRNREKRGFLSKFHPKRSGVLSGAWTSRYMILIGSRLEYYKNKNDNDARGSWELRQSIVEREGITNTKTRVFGKENAYYMIKLSDKRNPARKLRLSCSDFATGAEWYRLLVEASLNSVEKVTSLAGEQVVKNTDIGVIVLESKDYLLIAFMVFFLCQSVYFFGV